VLLAIDPEQLHVVEDAALIGAGPAAGVGLGEEGEEIAAQALADRRNDAVGIGALQDPERDLVMADEADHLFAHGEGHAEPPQDAASEERAADRVTMRGDTAVVGRARAVGLRDVVEQRAGEGDEPRVGVEGAEGCERAHRRADEVRMDGHVAFGVVDRILRRLVHAAHPRKPGVQLGPVDGPRGRRGYAEHGAEVRRTGRRDHGASARPLGTMGRASQCVPESTTEVRKLRRTHLNRSTTRSGSSTLM
jgi:hypothetical protein